MTENIPPAGQQCQRCKLWTVNIFDCPICKQGGKEGWLRNLQTSVEAHKPQTFDHWYQTCGIEDPRELAKSAWDKAWDLSWEAALASSPSQPDGWKLVPIHPTAEMLRSAGMMEGYDPHSHHASPDVYHVSWYQAMLAAAPTLGEGER